jgi:hypothetical protein
MGHVSDSGLSPFKRLRFARFLSSHLLVSDLQILAQDEGPYEGLDKLANTPPPDDGMEPEVDAFINSDGQFLLHRSLSQHV